MRISKDPQERKQEILDTAMKLFLIKGYNETTMADIAKEMNVVKGLCYRYFDSKQKLFEAAMEEYVKNCSEIFIETLQDKSKPFKEKLNILSSLMIETEKNAKYKSFFHKKGNEEFHETLIIKMYKYIYPYIKEEIDRLCKNGEINIKNSEILINFIIYGQIGLLTNTNYDIEITATEIKNYINKLIE